MENTIFSEENRDEEEKLEPQFEHMFPGLDFQLVGNNPIRGYMINFRREDEKNKVPRLCNYIEVFPWAYLFVTRPRLMLHTDYAKSFPSYIKKVPALLAMETCISAYHCVNYAFETTYKTLKEKGRLQRLRAQQNTSIDVMHMFKAANLYYVASVDAAINLFSDTMRHIQGKFQENENDNHFFSIVTTSLSTNTLQQWFQAHEVYFFKVCVLIDAMQFYLDEATWQSGKDIPVSKPFSLLSYEAMGMGTNGDLVFQAFNVSNRLTTDLKIYSLDSDQVSQKERRVFYLYYAPYASQLFLNLKNRDKDTYEKWFHGLPDLEAYTTNMEPILGGYLQYQILQGKVDPELQPLAQKMQEYANKKKDAVAQGDEGLYHKKGSKKKDQTPQEEPKEMGDKHLTDESRPLPNLEVPPSSDSKKEEEVVVAPSLPPQTEEAPSHNPLPPPQEQSVDANPIVQQS